MRVASRTKTGNKAWFWLRLHAVLVHAHLEAAGVQIWINK